MRQYILCTVGMKMIEAKLSEHNWLPHLQAVAEINLESASTIWRLNLVLWHSAWQQLALNERFRRLKRRSPLGCWSLRKRAGRSFGAAVPLVSLEIDRSKCFSTQEGFSPLGWMRKFLNEEEEFLNYWLQLCFLLVWLLMLLMVFLIWLLLGNFGLFRRSHKSSWPESGSVIFYLCHHRWYLEATLVV